MGFSGFGGNQEIPHMSGGAFIISAHARASCELKPNGLHSEVILSSMYSSMKETDSYNTITPKRKGEMPHVL